jgi:hypothetical protein
MADVDFDADISTLPQPPIVSSYMAVEVLSLNYVKNLQTYGSI